MSPPLKTARLSRINATGRSLAAMSRLQSVVLTMADSVTIIGTVIVAGVWIRDIEA